MSGDHNMNQVKQESEQYQSEIERQVIEMQSAIYLLNATVETLRQRLRPVMCERPQREAVFALSGTASPLGLSLQQYNAQIKSSCDDVVNIIESLEI